MENNVGAIKVSREELLQSQAALNNLGRVQILVQPDRYWLAKTLGKINTAVKRELRKAQDESNRLIGLLGTDVPDDKGGVKKGIAQTDVETMGKYAAGMDGFNAVLVTIENTRRIPLTMLQEAGIALSLADQAALQWLLQE